MQANVTRKAINFDLNTKALQTHYHNGSWQNAYNDLRSSLEKKGFEHRQYSGYVSENSMTYNGIRKTIKKLGKEFPWLKDCVNKLDVTEIGDTFDLKYILESKSRASEMKNIKETAQEKTQSVGRELER